MTKTNQHEGEGVSSIKTHYIVVSDEATDEVVREAIRIKAKMLDHDTSFHDIKVIRESELREYDQPTYTTAEP